MTTNLQSTEPRRPAAGLIALALAQVHADEAERANGRAEAERAVKERTLDTLYAFLDRLRIPRTDLGQPLEDENGKLTMVVGDLKFRLNQHWTTPSVGLTCPHCNELQWYDLRLADHQGDPWKALCAVISSFHSSYGHPAACKQRRENIEKDKVAELLREAREQRDAMERTLETERSARATRKR